MKIKHGKFDIKCEYGLFYTGDIFKFEKNYYIKTDVREEPSRMLAINLETGGHKYFDVKEVVEEVDGELVIK